MCGIISILEDNPGLNGNVMEEDKCGDNKEEDSSEKKKIESGSEIDVSEMNQEINKIEKDVKSGESKSTSTTTSSSSKGNATGSGRTRVALKPGHSLMDWIRLAAKNDLSGTGGNLLIVTPQELAKHSSADDCWLAVRGKVYNVTRYLDFHPGGVDEMMKGAGIDATRLFDDIHPWVNYESMLKKCLVGRMSNADF